MDDKLMETYLVMFALVAVFLVISAVIGFRDRKRHELKERARLRDSFGKPGAKEYRDGRYEQIPGYLRRHRADFEIDDITWNDLDMDLLYKRMDATCSSAGEEYLYWLLRSPRTDGGTYVSEEGLKWWTEHEKERIGVQRTLQNLGRSSKYSVYDYLELMNDLPDRKITADLPAVLMPAVSLAIMFRDPAVGLCCLLASFAFNIVTYYRAKHSIDPYLSTFRYVLRLLRCGRALASDPFPHYDREKEVMKETCRSFAGFERGSGILLRDTTGTTSGNPVDLLLDYLSILFHVDLFKFSAMLRELRGKEEEIDALITAIGSVDAQISIASWRKSLPLYCVPDLTGNRYEAEDLIHPLLQDPVPNSITTDKPVLLTGSNASGKSTFLKAAALAAVLAQSVHTAPAAGYRSSCYRIYTSMALRDDIRSGESYFIVEIRSLKRVLDAAADRNLVPVLCCVDEVLRGTNTIERISASAEILCRLADQPIQVFAATHDMELTELLKDVYVNYHFSETLDSEDVKFSYQIKEGPADSRNAIRLLRALGYDPGIADRAEERSAHCLETGNWKL